MACKAEKTERAYDLATLLNSPATIEAAIKIAQHNNYAKLAERINALNKVIILTSTMLKLLYT